jgi:hypothetical protein
VTYSLAVRLGSHATIVAATTDGVQRRLPLEDGRDWMPSSVWVSPDGAWQSGTAALTLAAASPEGFEPEPLRAAGEDHLLLSGRLVPASAAIGALLSSALAAAARAIPAPPSEVRLTYPAHWGPARRQALEQAAAMALAQGATPPAAGFGGGGLIAEPIAAAAGVGLRPERTIGPVAFLDIGGATTTATVLLAGPDGFAMAGPPAVREYLGGQDIDQLIVAHLGAGTPGQHEDWPELMAPASERFRQGALDLRAAVRAAKHQLSQRMAAQVAIPVLGLNVQLTRPELERLVLPVIDEMVEVLRQALAAASVAAADLAGLYLIGGSSRIPLVADRVWELIRAAPELPGDPEAASALGAAAGVVARRLASGSHFRGRLAGNRSSKLWRQGSSCTAQLALQGDGTLVHVTDSPAAGPDVAALAASAEQSLAAPGRGYAPVALIPAAVLGTDGLERRYTIGDGPHREPFIQRYLQHGDRWLMITAPERVREVADRLVIEADRVDQARSFELRVGADVPQGWSAAERIDLVRAKPGQRVAAESFDASPATIAAIQYNWCARTFPAPRYQPSGSGTSVFLARHRAVTVTFRDTASGAFTRVWSGLVDGRGYRTLVTTTRTEYLMLPMLESMLFLT